MVFLKDLLAEAAKFDAIKFFSSSHAQRQKKDGKEAKFVILAEKNMNFQHFEQVPNKTLIRSMKKKQNTEFRTLRTNVKYPESLKF